MKKTIRVEKNKKIIKKMNLNLKNANFEFLDLCLGEHREDVGGVPMGPVHPPSLLRLCSCRCHGAGGGGVLLGGVFWGLRVCDEFSLGGGSLLTLMMLWCVGFLKLISCGWVVVKLLLLWWWSWWWWW